MRTLTVTKNDDSRLGYMIGQAGDSCGKHIANVFEKDNATLFAAAPAMLAALESITDVELDDDGTRRVSPEDMAAVWAAIAQAKGH